MKRQIRSLAARVKNKYLMIRNPLTIVETFSSSKSFETSPGIIPSVCYQTWEDNKFRLQFAKNISSFHKMNKGVDFILYTSDQRNKYMNSGIWEGTEISHIYNQCLFGVMQADIFRYCILYEKGGFYIDIARKLPKNLLSYIDSESEYTLFFPVDQDLESLQLSSKSILHNMPLSRTVINGLLAFRANHRILENVINSICEIYPFYQNNVQKDPRKSLINLTGPGVLTRCVIDYSKLFNLESKSLYYIDLHSSKYNITGSKLRYLDHPYYGLSRNNKLFKN